MAYRDRTQSSRKVVRSSKWNPRTLFVAVLFSAVTAFITAILCGERPVWIDLEIAAVTAGIMLFILFFLILYYGVQIDVKQRWEVSFFKLNGREIDGAQLVEGLPDLVGSLEFIGPMFESGVVGMILSVILAVIIFLFTIVGLAFLLEFLFMLSVNVAICSFAVVVLPLFFIFRGSLEFVLRHVPSCRGAVLASLGWSFVYSLMKTMVLVLMIFGAHTLREWADPPETKRDARQSLPANEYL